MTAVKPTLQHAAHWRGESKRHAGLAVATLI
jgi:hypothetical protein